MTPKTKKAKKSPTLETLIREYCAAKSARTGVRYGIRAFAEDCGTSHSTIYNAMGGHFEPDHLTVARIAKGLKISATRVREALEQTWLVS